MAKEKNETEKEIKKPLEVLELEEQIKNLRIQKTEILNKGKFMLLYSEVRKLTAKTRTFEGSDNEKKQNLYNVLLLCAEKLKETE